MAKKDTKPGYGKLLDAWLAPEGAGDPIGCVATSFTFSPAFFEEECLARFLGLESDPREDGPAYLIEREEKLAPVLCAAAMVDPHHCAGERSLRWDLLAARVPGGLLHAKISLLCWSNRVRLMVSSVNLTEDGYRRNLEVFGVLDYFQGGQAPRRCLEEVVAFLRRIANSESAYVSPGARRVNRLLDRAFELARPWAVDDATHACQPLRVYPLMIGPGEEDAFVKLNELWPGGSRPHRGDVLSPFFDPPGPENAPAQRLWGFLRRNGEASVGVCTTAEPVPGEETYFVRAPESLLKAQPPGRSQVQTLVFRLNREDNRPLHAKGIKAWNERYVLYMIGSSNFTSAGLGLSARPNFEANLVYIIDTERAPKAAAKALQDSFPQKEQLAIDKVIWQPLPNADEAGDVGLLPLPVAFGSATYDRHGDSATLTLTLKAAPPSGWSVSPDEDGLPLCTDLAWKEQGAPETLVLPWTDARPPSGLWIHWNGASAPAWWPVNVASALALPPPAELKDLPLEVLINILTSARPLHRALGDYLRKLQENQDGNGVNTILIDPHKKVDTTQFLLQRTRRVSWGLAALRQRLERPVTTEECLEWRLRGPVGVKAVAQAILREAHSEEEKVFLISELALELARVKPQSFPGCLPPERVREALDALIKELREGITLESLHMAVNLRNYIEEVFACLSR